MNSKFNQIFHVENVDSLAERTAALIVSIGQKAIEENGFFNLVFSGGNTPILIYKNLIRLHAEQLDWKKVSVFFTDERNVPPTSLESNYYQCKIHFLDHINVHKVFRMKGEIDVNDARDEYISELREHFLDKPITFDFILLGVGPDGHIASLFDIQQALDNQYPVVSNYIEKLGMARVSLSMETINNAKNCILILSGEKKRKILELITSQNLRQDLPVELLACQGNSYLITDLTLDDLSL